MKTRKGFSDEKRMLIIQAYFDGASKNSLCRKYNLASSRTISNWLRIFGIEDTRTTYIPTAMNKTVKQPVILIGEALKTHSIQLQHTHTHTHPHIYIDI